MNKNQIKGASKDLAGKLQESTGKLVGSKEQQARGLLKQVEGKAEKRLGDAKEVIKDAIDKT
ncbi:CsbD family protein [Chitinimonas naiadis]